MRTSLFLGTSLGGKFSDLNQVKGVAQNPAPVCLDGVAQVPCFAWRCHRKVEGPDQ